MKTSLVKYVAVAALGTVLSLPGLAAAQQAGSSTLGIEVTKIEAVAKGWSIRKSVLDKAIFNDKGEEIGTITDVIATPDDALSYAIISDGGYLGVAEHYVAVPVSQIKIVDGKFQLPGATKDTLQKAPAFVYAE